MDKYKTLLQAHKLKATPGRLLILSMFFENDLHLSAEEIYKSIKTKKINFATVYRTLSSLLDAGIIKEANLSKSAVFYELADSHHHHIICSSCGDVENFDMCGIEDIEKKILSRTKKFRKINSHSLELFGFCKKCAN
jgi:Fe2+ or Zn2+ uptake regulation protein